MSDGAAHVTAPIGTNDTNIPGRPTRPIPACMEGAATPMSTMITALREVLLAPVRVVGFLADCALRPRPWDARAWVPHQRAH